MRAFRAFYCPNCGTKHFKSTFVCPCGLRPGMSYEPPKSPPPTKAIVLEGELGWSASLGHHIDGKDIELEIEDKFGRGVKVGPGNYSLGRHRITIEPLEGEGDAGQ